ncbi:Sugar phosphate permease [Enhydrobacter aerosaccus]|uniref:Sugar phosphate permease n=1 Tax=Enhydrobacter aerosaccus TaxID=225324 RepID=A0A1T4RH99_9HYPH|nr:MFS transporter [Enhydrobacter aerosaccus]SKA15345.1 Sugar phosphate permease [Enhydrobacter aerosaccus]
MRFSYGWVVVGAGALMGCVAIGALFSLAVFLQPMTEATGWSRTGVSSAMTLDFLTMGVAAFGWGALTDRFGPRIVVLSGAVLLGLGLVIASRATSLLEFQLVYGIIVGAAAGAIFAPMIATVTGWFEKHRSLAVSLVSAGMGVAPMTISPFARWLISAYDWRTAQIVIGVFAWLLLVPTAMLVRRPPSLSGEGAMQAGAAGSGKSDMTVRQALRSPQFIVLALTFFCCCATHSGPIFHTVSYAIACGLAPMAAVTIYSAEGLAGLVGRIVFGLAGDRFGAKPVVVAGLLIQALAAGGYFFTRQLDEFYTVAVVFGMAYGGVMPLYAVIAREYFPMRIMGTVFGAAAMISSLGMALGPAVGGWIYDSYGSYGWLYIGSFGIGLGAAAIALTFPPLPSRSRPSLQPA